MSPALDLAGPAGLDALAADHSRVVPGPTGMVLLLDARAGVDVVRPDVRPHVGPKSRPGRVRRGWSGRLPDRMLDRRRSRADPGGQEAGMDTGADDRSNTERIGATRTGAPVVVGVDGGTDSLDAVRWAAAQARLRGVALRIVHTAGWSSDGGAARGRGPRADLGAAFTVARRAQPGLDVSTCPSTTGRGAPVGVAEDAQLLALGSGDGLRSAALALDAPGGATHPVAVVRGRARADDGPVLVGVNDPRTDAVVLAVAFAEAELRGCPLLVLHALGAPLGHPAGSSTTTVRLAEAVSLLTEQHPSVSTRIRLVPRAATRALLTAAHDARIVVIGAHRHGSRSLARELLRRSPVPVLLVPPGSRTPRPAHPVGPAGAGRRRGPVGNPAHDGVRAVAVLQHGVADRAEDQAGGVAAPVPADHQELGSG